MTAALIIICVGAGIVAGIFFALATILMEGEHHANPPGYRTVRRPGRG